jgi:hypothetical protein
MLDRAKTAAILPYGRITVNSYVSDLRANKGQTAIMKRESVMAYR